MVSEKTKSVRKKLSSRSSLIMFYGQECPHCHQMMPLVEKLEKEMRIKIEKLEVWHSKKNLTRLEKADTSGCGGVPFFYNEKTKKPLCGSCSYAELKAWAKGS